jgi:hypothetical protein
MSPGKSPAAPVVPVPWGGWLLPRQFLAGHYWMSAAFPDKEIMLIWDQAGWHKSDSLKVPDNIVS